MGIQYLLANNDSAETITVKFKHFGEFEFQLELRTASHYSLQILWRYIKYLQLTIKIFIVLYIIGRS